MIKAADAERMAKNVPSHSVNNNKTPCLSQR